MSRSQARILQHWAKMRILCLALLGLAPLAAEPVVSHAELAGHITQALKLSGGERVLLRFDPAYFSELRAPLDKALRAAKAVPSFLAAAEPLRAPRLEGVDVFVRLPLGSSARVLSKEEDAALIAWVDKGGTRRELHFHWSDGSRGPDGLPVQHPPAFDGLYADALNIDYAALNAAQERAIALLSRGTVRVQTPAGTDLMFRTGKRPFNRQNGDASAARMASARVRVDRHIELPAGAVRVAPVEGGVFGQLVLPEARFGDTVAKKVVIQIDNGRITSLRAEQGLDAVKAALQAGGDAAQQVREFALGFNPKLTMTPGGPVVPYYGYGAGVVRIGLGDNEELGGAVRGGFVRWLFLTDASLHVDYTYLVKDGKLVLP